MMNSIEASSNSLGGGWGGFNFGGGGLVEGLLLGTLFRNGFGGNCEKTDGYSRDGYGSGAANLSYLMGRASGEEAKYRDIVDSTSSITGAIRTGFDFTTANINRVDTSVAAGFASLAKEVCENKYDALIQFKDIATQLAASTCAIQRAVEKDGDETRALINAHNTQNLRDALDETRRQRDLLATGNFPISQPAHVHRHHCNSQEDGVQVQVNNVNQNVQALGSVVGQIAEALNRLNAQMAKTA